MHFQRDQCLKIDIAMVLIHYSPLRCGQPLYGGQNGRSQCVLNKDIPLSYSPLQCTPASL